MNITEMTLEELIRELPTDLRMEIRNYAEFLLTKHTNSLKKQRHLSQEWADALTDSHPDLSSVDLQHLASKLREEVG